VAIWLPCAQFGYLGELAQARPDRALGGHAKMTEDLQEIQPDTVAVGLDLDLPVIRLEIVDPTGAGFSALFDVDEVIDLCCRLLSAVAKLRRWDRSEVLP